VTLNRGKTPIWYFRSWKKKVTKLEASPDGNMILGCTENKLFLFDLRKKDVLLHSRISKGIKTIKWHPEYSYFYAFNGENNGDIKICSTDLNAPTRSVIETGTPVRSILWKEKENIIVNGGNDDTSEISIWNIENKEKVASTQTIGSKTKCITVFDTFALALQVRTEVLSLWNIPTLKRETKVPKPLFIR